MQQESLDNQRNQTGHSMQSTSFECNICSRTFSTSHGRNIHLSSCRKRNLYNSHSISQETSNTESTPIQPKIWGDYNKEDIYKTVDNIYEKIVYWRRNLFKLPSGAAGKKFVAETTKWIEYWNIDATYYKDIALKVLMMMPALLLQKPNFKSTSKQHSQCLIRRLQLWELGDLNKLLSESSTIQAKLPTNPKGMNDEKLSKSFAKLVLEGKIKAAMKLLDQQNSKGVLPLSQSTIDELTKKHPDASEPDPTLLIDGNPPFVDPVMFESITESTIAESALRTKGSSGPSGLDADGWRRILVSKNFGSPGQSLREALASFARKISTVEVEVLVENDRQYTNLEAYTACRLIPLDKNPGVRPIGVGEVLRRIVGKAILSVIKPDIMSSAGNLQLCAGQAGGCEAAVHAMNDIFNEQATDALLLVDADNAFNSLNRKVLLHNIGHLCPPMAVYIKNCYNVPSRLFVLGGTEILSSEGTTQGDPLAMPVYAIGITPLLDLIKPAMRSDTSMKHVAFADDLINVRRWWDNIVIYGPKLGYNPNAAKSWLIVKPETEELAREIFRGTRINITIEGRKYLGGFIGSKSECGKYEEELVNSWCEQLRVLSKIAKTEPQAAYAAFVNGFKHKLTYHIRTLPNIKQHLVQLDTLVNQLFIPAITDGHMCSDDERLLISLPVKKGGLAIPIFSSIAELEFSNSRTATDQLIKHINDQASTAQIDSTLLKNAKRNIVKAREEHNDTILQQLRAKMSPEQLRANDLAMMKGASSWLTTLPLKVDDYNLNKREFYDSLCLRYRWTPKYLPPVCPCGKSFNVDHAMSCMKGGFAHRRHDEVRDLFASLLQDVCHDVEIEPPLQALS